MSREGYVSAKRTRIEEISARSEQAGVADGIATQLVKKYAYYNTDENSPLRTPEVYWDEASPDELAYMELYDADGAPLEGAEGLDPKEDAYNVKRADFILGPGDTIFGRVFSVSVNSITEPPYVKGLEGELLEAPEIEQVIVDLNRYERALESRPQQ